MTRRIVLTNLTDVREEAGFDGYVEIDGVTMRGVRGVRADFRARSVPEVTLFFDATAIELHIDGTIKLPEKEVVLLRRLLDEIDCDEG